MNTISNILPDLDCPEERACFYFSLGFKVYAVPQGTAGLDFDSQVRFADPSESRLRKHWRLHPDDGVYCPLPSNVVIIAAHGPDAQAELYGSLKQFGVPPSLVVNTGSGVAVAFYRLSDEARQLLSTAGQPGVDSDLTWLHGRDAPLFGGTLTTHNAHHVTELGELDVDDIEALIAQLSPEASRQEAGPETADSAPLVLLPDAIACEAPDYVSDEPDGGVMEVADEQPALKVDRSHPLSRYSLIGDSGRLAEELVEALPVLGPIALLGQLTMIFAAANVGKTLLTLHLLTQGLENLDAAKVHYVNVDDNLNGLHEKLMVAEEHGFHMLAEGHRGFRANQLVPTLQQLTATGQAHGVIVIVDTLKKFLDVIDKKAARAFMMEARRFVMAGGTFIALAHNNKKAGADGKFVYAGTSDLQDDADCTYMLEVVREVAESGERVVRFRQEKSRHPMQPDRLGFAYAYGQQLPYPDLISSVRQIANDAMDELDFEVQLASDEAIIAAIEACIAEGIVSKMKLAKTAAAKAGASRRAVEAVLDRHAGDDPSIHRWQLAKGGARGAFTYTLHQRPTDTPDGGLAS